MTKLKIVYSHSSKVLRWYFVSSTVRRKKKVITYPRLQFLYFLFYFYFLVLFKCLFFFSFFFFFTFPNKKKSVLSGLMRFIYRNWTFFFVCCLFCSAFLIPFRKLNWEMEGEKWKLTKHNAWSHQHWERSPAEGAEVGICRIRSWQMQFNK